MSELVIGGGNGHLIFEYKEDETPGVAYNSGKAVSTSCMCIGWPHTEYIKNAHRSMEVELQSLKKQLEMAREKIQKLEYALYGDRAPITPSSPLRDAGKAGEKRESYE